MRENRLIVWQMFLELLLLLLLQYTIHNVAMGDKLGLQCPKTKYPLRDGESFVSTSISFIIYKTYWHAFGIVIIIIIIMYLKLGLK